MARRPADIRCSVASRPTLTSSVRTRWQRTFVVVTIDHHQPAAERLQILQQLALPDALADAMTTPSTWRERNISSSARSFFVSAEQHRSNPHRGRHDRFDTGHDLDEERVHQIGMTTPSVLVRRSVRLRATALGR